MIRIYHVHIWCWYVMFTYDFDTFSSMFTYGFNMLCSHIMFIYDSDMWENLCWYVMFICKHHKRWSYVNKIMLVYDYSSIHMWTSYVSIISQQHTNMYMIILQFICEHHMWASYPNNVPTCIWLFFNSYVNIIYQHHIPTICTMKMMFTYDFGWCSHMILSDVCIWFLYMMFTYDAHMWVFSFPYMISVYDVHIWFSSIIICLQAYDHMREIICDLLTRIWCSHMSKHAYDVHMWTLFPMRWGRQQ